MSIPPWFGFSDNRWTKPPGKTQCRRYSVEEGRLGLRTPSTSTKTRGVGNSMASKVREPSRQSPRLHAGCEHSLGVAKGCGARYLLALSICLPIIAPPQVRGREIFLDGALLENLPVKGMAEMGEGPSIAVDVKAAFERSNDGTAVPGVRDNRPARLPRLGETLTRVLLLGNENTTEAAWRHDDLLIKARAEGAGLLEFHQLD